MVRALEADGERDDHCLACGGRPGLTPEQHAAMVAERNGYDDSGVRRKQRGRGPDGQPAVRGREAQMRRGAR